MAEILGVVGTIVGIIQVTTQVAQGLATLVQDIRDAPSDILYIKRDVTSLAAVLASTYDTSLRYNLHVEDQALTRALAEYLDMCKASMQDIQNLLEPLVQKGLGSRNPFRIIEWRLRKGEVQTLRARLNEGKASLNLTISALNGVLEGKGQEEVKDEIQKLYTQITVDFKGFKKGRDVQRRIEEDTDTDSVGDRRTSISASTDHGFIMGRFLEQRAAVNNPAGIILSSSNAPVAEGSPEGMIWPGDRDAIFEAVRSQNTQFVQALISQGVGLSTRSAQGLTALHYCCIFNDKGIAELLIKNGSQINAKDYQLRSPFKLALASNALEVAGLLAEHGCFISDAISDLQEIATTAEDAQGLPDLLRSLSKRLRHSEQWQLIHPAVRSGDTKYLAMLVDAGFNPCIQDKNGLSLFFYALLHGKRPVMKLLAERGADLNEWISSSIIDDLDSSLPWCNDLHYESPAGATPLVVAAKVMNNPGMTKFLLDLGADPNFVITGDGGGIALMGVCAARHLEAAAELVKAGANPNHLSYDGHSSMYWATRCCNLELVKMLIEYGGDANYQCREDGNTLTAIAAYDGETEIVRVLDEAGADMAIRNHDGETPLDIAKSSGKKGLIRYLTVAEMR